MAKKITITFNSQPTAGLGLNYEIKLGSLNYVYPNGKTAVNFNYYSLGFPSDDKVQISGLGLSATINNTLAYLVKYHSACGVPVSL